MFEPDQLPWPVGNCSHSIKLINNISYHGGAGSACDGKAMAYLEDYWVKEMPLKRKNVNWKHASMESKRTSSTNNSSEERRQQRKNTGANSSKGVETPTHPS